MNKKFLKIISIVALVIICGKLCLEKYLTINISSSISPGIYLRLPLDKLNRGDIVIYDMPKDIDKFVHEREYIINKCHSFIKVVGGLEGDLIENKKNILYINNNKVGEISLTDTIGRELPQIKDFVVSKDYFFPIGNHKNSFDGRYYGQVHQKYIKNKAKLILKF